VSATHILLIDDDQVDRASVKRALAKSGLDHVLVEAADGLTGLALAKAKTFDCVLLDFRLPDVDTFELLQTLTAPEGGSHAVLMLTGEADHEVAHRLISAGALDYLTKGETTPSSLTRAIRYAEARRHFVSELRSARLEAEEKSLALDALNRQKSLFFSIIAHDLRNPFQAILGFADLLRKAVTAKDYAALDRRTKALHDAANQAHTLMEGLFGWADVQMDTLVTPLGDVDMDAVATLTLQGTASAAADKEIVVATACSGVHVLAHQDMLAAVLRNLVSNAIKFTLPHGRVTIAAEAIDASVTISVSDTGIGMDPGKLDDLFKLDRRSSTAGTAGERGSGLGLLLCRDLVEKQGSALTVTSTVGRGTCFRFVLPVAKPDNVVARSLI
jgi:two-component system sensor histidine kinase/response regulator